MTSVITNYMRRRNAERVDTEEPQEELQDVSENNSITDEEHGEEGEFVGTSDTSAQESGSILESLPEDEEVHTGLESPGVEGAEPTTTAATPATLTSSRERTTLSLIHI